MKYIKYFLLFFISLLILNVNVLAASSKFEPILDVETEIIDNQVFLIIGYEGEDVLALTQEIAYENKYLELVNIAPLGDFEITQGVKKDQGTYSTVKILADSNKVYNDVKYAILVFDIKEAFRVGKSATVFLYNYDSIGPNKDKYRHKGFEIEVKRDTATEAMFLKNPIDNMTKTKHWFREHLIIFIIIFILIILGILFIFLIPSTRKEENRSKDLKKKIATATDKKNSIAPIKLDQEFISSLGEEKKEVDMSGAIEVSDVKPFGNAASRFDQKTDAENAALNVSADAFALEASGMKDLEEDDEDDEVEVLSSDDSSDDKIDTLGLFIIIFITSTLFIGAVGAIEYNITDLKENIVNDLKYDKELDYNNDGKIDLADLLETKDLNNIEQDKELYDVPNYEPIEPID